tara:strand:- start:5080 stop:5253 length:174 start_codon:yes stop_codon:yes gene_type:complete
MINKKALAKITLREPTAIGLKPSNAITENIKTDPKHVAKANRRIIDTVFDFNFITSI